MNMPYGYYTPHSTSSTVSYSLRDHLIKEYYTM